MKQEINFSKLEEKILKELRKFKKGLLISKLSKRVYRNVIDKPMNPNNSVVSTIKQINKKCVKSKARWGINGAGLGRKGKTVWIDPGFNKQN